SAFIRAYRVCCSAWVLIVTLWRFRIKTRRFNFAKFLFCEGEGEQEPRKNTVCSCRATKGRVKRFQDQTTRNIAHMVKTILRAILSVTTTLWAALGSSGAWCR
ncbi:MAG: hypothetical protein IKD01_04795, partial [Oscillospiraceae bacterium]|nr:hypothetical protein [Oscillospiraceae bacterium]